jgi:hypothetical protein
MYRSFPRMLARAGALVLLSVAVYAERPPLTLEMADHATGYMEWMLEVRFSAEQRYRYQQTLAEMWRGSDQGAKDAIAKMALVHEKLSRIGESEQAQKRATSQKEFIRLLETASDDNSRWLLAIYRSAHNGVPQPAAAVMPVSRPAQTSAALRGRWTDGHISSIQYQNAYTGASAPTNGRMFAYEFKADGTYSLTGLMQSVVYNCTTAMFSNETGTYTVEGDAVSLRPQKNPYRMTNNCAPSSNREAPGKLLSRTYRFRIVAEGGRRYLELRGDDGAVQKFGDSR